MASTLLMSNATLERTGLHSPVESGPPPRRKTSPSVFLCALASAALIFTLAPNRLYDALHIGGQECSKPDPITGFIHLQNKSIVWTREGFSSGITNSAGFVDDEHSLQKPPGVFRIAILGDSMTEALQVEQKERFSNLLERKLNGLSKGKFEVLNFGVSAAGTGQEYLTYLRYVREYKPDLVLLFFDNGDEDKNLRKPIMAEWHPHVNVYARDGKLFASWRDYDSWLHSATAIPIACFEPLRKNSRAFGALIEGFNNLKSEHCYRGFTQFLDRIGMLDCTEDFLTNTFPIARFGSDQISRSEKDIQTERKAFCAKSNLIYSDQDAPIPRFNDKDWEFGREAIYHTHHLNAEQQNYIHAKELERVQNTERILKDLGARCKANHSRLIVFGVPTLTNKSEFHNAFERMKISASEGGWSAHDLTPEFDRATRNCTPRFAVHFSSAGHEAVANAVLDYLLHPSKLDADAL